MGSKKTLGPFSSQMVGEFPTAVPLGFSISGFGGICCRLCSALISRLQSWGWRRGNGTGTFFAGLICFQDMEFGHCLGRFFFWTCEAATNNKLGLISVDLVIRGDSFGGMSSLTGAGNLRASTGRATRTMRKRRSAGFSRLAKRTLRTVECF